MFQKGEKKRNKIQFNKHNENDNDRDFLDLLERFKNQNAVPQAKKSSGVGILHFVICGILCAVAPPIGIILAIFLFWSIANGK